eukprot:TRINITY_DN8498_c4_g1_i1.p2 TRINITY_DN8498_c4_g1~~TRINITY_DN8498_c4_g1_i1.p2  ORF type:complete len:282 (+),score=108.14 TRINITY_DN8498_c4_g1_i1:74-919(+)
MGCGASQEPRPDAELTEELRKLRESQQTLVQQHKELLEAVGQLRGIVDAAGSSAQKYAANASPDPQPPIAVQKPSGHQQRERKAGFTDVPSEDAHRVQRKPTTYSGGSREELNIAGDEALVVTSDSEQEYSGIPVVKEEAPAVTWECEQDEGGPRVRRQSTGFSWNRAKMEEEEAKAERAVGFTSDADLKAGKRVSRQKTGVKPSPRSEEGPSPAPPEADGKSRAVNVTAPDSLAAGRVSRKKTGAGEDFHAHLAAARAAAAAEDDEDEEEDAGAASEPRD